MVRSPSHPPWRAEASGGPIGHHATPDQDLSGPNRRIKEMPLCVSEAAFFENPAWLKVGFELLQWLATFGRDYLLLKLKSNFAIFEKKMAEYADVVAVLAAILQRAGIPATEHSRGQCFRQFGSPCNILRLPAVKRWHPHLARKGRFPSGQVARESVR